MPKEAPTYMNPFLEESAYFFPNPKDEVALVVNCGYCPPFLHRLAFVKIVYVLRGSCFFFIGGERILMKKGSFCLVGPNVEQAVYSCNDEDIVVNLIMRFSSFAESFLGLMREQGIMSEFLWRMLYSRTDNGCLMYDGKEEKIVTENVKNLCEEILFETQNPSSLIRKSMLLIFYRYTLLSPQSSQSKNRCEEAFSLHVSYEIHTKAVQTFFQSLFENIGSNTLHLS